MAGTTRRRGIIAEINVTPLVDIMLVLLIIFMLTAHLIAKQAIEVELPRASNSTTLKPTTLAITLTKDGAIYLDDKPTTVDALKAAITAAVAKDPKTQAVISGDVVCELPMYTRNYVQEGGGIQLGKSDKKAKAQEVTP